VLITIIDNFSINYYIFAPLFIWQLAIFSITLFLVSVFRNFVFLLCRPSASISCTIEFKISISALSRSILKQLDNFNFFIQKLTMERVKRTTAKLTPREVDMSERTPQLRSGGLNELSSEMPDTKVLRPYAPENRSFSRTTATAVGESPSRYRVDPHRSYSRSSQISSTLLKWLVERLTRSSGPLAVFTLLAVWGWWNSQLLAATGLGIGTMMLVYRAESWDWQQLRSNFNQFWHSPSRRLLLAVGSGGSATVGTYMSFSIWADSSSHWIALSAILQNFGTIAIIALLVRQVLSHSASKDEAVVDRILADLTDADPVKRLIAVRQMTDLVKGSGFGKQSSLKSSIGLSHTAECFRLMLSQEPEALVRNALLESLQTLDVLRKPNQAQSFCIPNSPAMPQEPYNSRQLKIKN